MKLKKIKFTDGYDGNCISCDLYVNNVKVYHCWEDQNCCGLINCDDVSNTQKVKDQIKILNDFIKKQPPFENNGYKLKYTIDNLIYDLYKKQEKGKKDYKEFLKLQVKSIIFGYPNKYDEYSFVEQKKPLSEFNKNSLQNFINTKIKPNLKEGMVILNTNLDYLDI